MTAPRTLAEGFLGQLARRLDAAEPVLQRRQPARFEPVQPWTGDVAGPAETTPAGRSAADDAAVPVAPLPLPRAERAAATSRAASPAAAAPVARPSDAAAHASARSPRGEGEAASRAVAVPAPPPLAPPAIAESIRPPRETLVRDTRVVVERSVPAPSPPAAAVARPMPAPSPPPRADARAAPAPVAAWAPMRLPALDATLGAPRNEKAAPPRAADTGALARPAAPPRAPLAPVAASARRAARSPDAPARPAPAALPPIEVTIGRVEIRAVAPAPAPARPARAAGPRLSLDDYLRQRDGGGGTR